MSNKPTATDTPTEIAAEATATDDQTTDDGEAEADTVKRDALLKVSIGATEPEDADEDHAAHGARRLVCVIVETEDDAVKLPTEGELFEQIAASYREAGLFVTGGVVNRGAKASYRAGQYHYERATIHVTEPKAKAERVARVKRSDEEANFSKAMIGLRKRMAAGESESAAWLAASTEAGFAADDAAAIFTVMFKRAPKDAPSA